MTMNLGKFRNVGISIVLLIAHLNLAGASQDFEKNVISLTHELTQLTQMMKTTFEQYGIGEVRERLYQVAADDFDLLQYKQDILEINNGRPLVVEVAVHPTNLNYVTYANAQLNKAGIDFIQYQGIADSSLPPLNAPLPSEEKQALYWKIARSIITPSMGFLATILMDHQLGAASDLAHDVYHHMISHPVLTQVFTQDLFDGIKISPELKKDLIVGTSIWVLEQQFNWFTNSWAKLWQDDRPLHLKVNLVRFAELPQNRHFHQTVNKLVVKLNRVASAIHDVANYKKDTDSGMSFNDFLSQLTYSHLWSYLVNWGYAATLYSIGIYAGQQMGLTHDSWDFLDLVMKSGVMTTAFYLAFGLDQVILAQLTSRGEITPLLRQKVESVAGFWNNFWRVGSSVPGLYGLGVGMQLAWGAIITAPLYWKLHQLEKMNRETKALFEKNQSQGTRRSLDCLLVFEEPISILYRGQTMLGIGKKVFK